MLPSKLRTLVLGLLCVIAMSAAAPAGAATHTIDQSNLTWSPSTLTITEGDTVRWAWHTLSHTVTNGTGALDPSAGILFDSPLNSTSPVVAYVFATAGTYPYFCRPHEGFNMKGTITVDVATSVRTPATVSATLNQNFPNPFGGRTEIAYALSAESRVLLRVYDTRGALVATLVEGRQPDGSHRVAWDGRDDTGEPVPNGVYFYRLESGSGTITKKLVLIR